MRIVVVGAGIGGLTAALCLHKAGFAVTVLEQSPQLAAVGAGIQCGANALKVIRYLGLDDALRPVAVAPTAAVFKDHQSGAVLSRMTLGAAYETQYGAPYWHLHRADLQKVLFDALSQRSPESVHLGCTVQSFEEYSDHVVINTSDGLVECDVLIGADGVHSQIRQQLLGKNDAMFSGLVAWRAVVETNRLPAHWMPTVVSNFVGPDRHAVLYYINGGRQANLVGVVKEATWEQGSWMTQGSKSALQKTFEGWHTTVTDLVGAVDSQACFRWPLLSHPSGVWPGTARVALLGDAAHSTLPFMAAGASMAIEDARVLERALSSAVSPDEGLLVYRATRESRTASVQTQSAQLGRFYHLKNRLSRRLGFAALQMAMRVRGSFLPSYDANTVALASER